MQEGGVLLFARYPGGAYSLLSRLRPHTVSHTAAASVTITWRLLDSALLLQRMPKMRNLLVEEEAEEEEDASVDGMKRVE